MAGIELIDELCRATGLPIDFTRGRFIKILGEKNKSPENITLEEIRELLSELLQDVLLEAKSEFKQAL